MKSWWIFLVPVLTLFLGGCAQPVWVLNDSLNKPVYTRCVLRASGPNIVSSNYTGEGGFKPGTEAKITKFSSIRVDIDLNKIPHKMTPVGGKFDTANIEAFIEKYFVNSESEVGLEKIEDSTRGNVEAGVAAIGMTKDEVYMALGPPAQINFGETALTLPRATILEANRWVYFSNWFTPFWFQHVYLFEDDKLTTVEQ